LSLTLFGKDPLEQLLANSDYKTAECDTVGQFKLFENLTRKYCCKITKMSSNIPSLVLRLEQRFIDIIV